jgi:hypothetical protein
MIHIQLQTRLFQPSLLDDWPREKFIRYLGRNRMIAAAVGIIFYLRS